ncbi:hypothetical protein IPN35_05785 [Candidatus Peregrinibacteria bacterium]|nr:MAG: hypothetical protein IPN35_05785 [Candidatus Peregrinibacteria bacterium]
MKDIILVNHNGYVLVDVFFFGDPSVPLDIVLNCPHGCRDIVFLEAFPQIKNAFSHIPEEIFQTYLELEYDFGARDLAFSVATELSHKRNVAVTRVHYHRGIVDANRTEAFAVRNIFDRERFPEVDMLLKKISRDTEAAIIAFLQQHLSPNGFFYDNHTMWPTSQYISPREHEKPDTLEKYIGALLETENQKKVRSVNMITSDENNVCIADEIRSNIFANTLQEYGYPVDFNTPYRLFPQQHLGARYLSLFSGVAVDIPRPFLGNPDEKNIAQWNIDETKMKRLIPAVSEGLLLAYEKRVIPKER